MIKDKQTQKTGNNSNALQVGGNLQIYQGISYSEAKEIALDVYRSNFIQLSGEAAEIAKKRVEDFTEGLISKLQEVNASLLNEMKNPDMQYAIYTAQTEYARTGDEDLAEILINLLVARAEENEKTLMQIVLNESLGVLPKLTSEQLDILSLVFILKYTMNYSVLDFLSLKHYIEKNLIFLAKSEIPTDASFQHLEYTGCASITVLPVSFEERLLKAYSGLFSNGFSIEDFKTITSDKNHEVLIMGCLHDNNKYQFNAINSSVIEEKSEKYGILPDKVEKFKELHEKTLLSKEQVQDFLLKTVPNSKKLIDYWNNSRVKNITLTSVGTAIAHANLARKGIKDYDLSIWIN